MIWIGLGALLLSALCAYAIVRGRVRRPAAWALGAMFVFLAVQAAMQFVMAQASEQGFYGVSALRKARDEGAITQGVYDRERARTVRAFIASMLAAVVASAGYGFAVRISSKRKSA